MVALMSYVSVMILMSLTIVFKIGMELSKRKGNFENLCRLGFSLEQLKRIIKRNDLFLCVILLLPLSYQIIILCNLLLRAKITFYLFLIILIIQIVPLFISYLLSIKLIKAFYQLLSLWKNNYLKNLLKKDSFFFTSKGLQGESVFKS